jgi:hypothetical protein
VPSGGVGPASRQPEDLDRQWARADVVRASQVPVWQGAA